MQTIQMDKPKEQEWMHSDTRKDKLTDAWLCKFSDFTVRNPKRS